MSGSHGNSTPTVLPSYTSLQVQTSSNAIPIPIVWGTNVIAPNIVWAEGFQAVPQYTASRGSGKGGGGTTYSVASYTYTIAIIMGLCEGPTGGTGTIWKGQSALSILDMNPPNMYVKDASVTLFSGTTPQAVWGYLSGSYPSEAIAYPGLAYIASPNYQLGSSGTLDVTDVEIFGGLRGTSPVTSGTDADPASIIHDFLINAQYGVGFPASAIDATRLFGTSGDASYQTYCAAAGLALSPALVNQEAGNSILARWLQLTNTAAIWSGGLLKFIPFGDAEISSFGTTFTPNLTPLYDLDDDDFVAADGDDPLQIARSDPYAAYNTQPLEMLDRGNSYAAATLSVFDQNAIDLYGEVAAPTITAHEICDSTIAMNAAQLILQRGLYVRNMFHFKLSWEYCLLEPMDLVTVTDAGLGLTKNVVRIMEIDEGEDGLLEVTAEEFPAGIATATSYPVQTSTGFSLDRNTAPASVNPPLIFEPPAAITASGSAEVWIGLSGGRGGTSDPNWGGAILWISQDDATYAAIGSINAPARQGVLTGVLASDSGQASDMPPFAHLDMSHTLAVDLSESKGELNSGSAADAQNAVTLCVVDNELLSYTNATLSGASSYTLTGLARGVYGSTAGAHAGGAPFTRLDEAIFKYVLPANYVGTAFYLKFQSFNVFGNALQSLAACTAYSYRPIGSGAFGPVATALAAGNAVDCGAASATAAEFDDMGVASDPYPNFIDLGLASS